MGMLKNLLAPLDEYTVIHAHDQGIPCTKDCRYVLSAWGKIKRFFR